MYRIRRLHPLAAGLCGLLLPAVSFGAAAVHEAEVAQAGMQERLGAGAQGYENYCQSCHQPTGTGMAGVFPPLAASDYLLADKDRAVDVVLDGLSGPSR